MKSVIRWIVGFQPRLWAGEYGPVRLCAYTCLRAASSEIMRLRDGNGWRVSFGPKAYRCLEQGNDVYPQEPL